jgi:hypothetical protein
MEHFLLFLVTPPRLISQDVFCRNPSLRFVRKRHLERIRLAASEKKNFELL